LRLYTRFESIVSRNAVFATTIVLGVLPAVAEENGGGLWSYGVQTILPAILPPPGVIDYYQYDLYYSASSFKNGQGKSVSPNISAEAFGHASRVVYTWPLDVNGLHFSSDATLFADAQTLKTGPTFQQTNAGIEQFYVEPGLITYRWGDFHFLASAGFFTPGSHYDPNRVANASSNYWGIANVFAVTWLPSPRWELSAEFNFIYNFRNPATHYLSGNMFDMDYGVTYRPFDALPDLAIGFSGFLAEQLSADQLASQYVPGGNYFRKFAIGPEIVYSLGPHAALVFKWQREIAARNTTQGDRVWFEFAFPLGAIGG